MRQYDVYVSFLAALVALSVLLTQFTPLVDMDWSVAAFQGQLHQEQLQDQNSTNRLVVDEHAGNTLIGGDGLAFKPPKKASADTGLPRYRLFCTLIL